MLNQNWYIVNKKHPRTPGIRNGSNHMMGCDCNCTWYQPSPSLASYFYKFSHNYFLAPIFVGGGIKKSVLRHSQALFWSCRRPFNRYPASHISRDPPPQWENLELSCAQNCLPCDGRCLEVVPRWKHLQRPRKEVPNTLETSLINPKVVHCQSLGEESY